MPRISELNKCDRGVVLYQRGMSLRQAASAVGVSRSGLQAFMAKHNIDRRGPGRTITLAKPDAQSLVDKHHKERKSLREIAKEVGHDRETVKRLIKAAGYLTFSAQQMRNLQRDRRDEELAGEIVKMYRSGWPLKQIARALHTDQRRVRRVVVHGIEK